MTDRSPERTLAHLRYQLAAERAAGARRDADLGRLRCEVDRLAILVGERHTPPPIVVPEPPAPRAAVAKVAPPPPRTKQAPRKPYGWIVAQITEHGPMTAKELARAVGCALGAVRKSLRGERPGLTSTRTGDHLELRYALRKPGDPPMILGGPKIERRCGWIIEALATHGPMTMDQLVARTGHNRVSVHNAIANHRSQIARSGRRRSRVYAVAEPAALAAG